MEEAAVSLPNRQQLWLLISSELALQSHSSALLLNVVHAVIHALKVLVWPDMDNKANTISFCLHT